MAEAAAVQVRGLSHRYRHRFVLRDIDLDIPAGALIGLIGPDGVGKSTLLGLVAGIRSIQNGAVTILGGPMRDSRHRHSVCPRIGYLPQGLGQHLYAELTVNENIRIFAELFGLGRAEIAARSRRLLSVTGLSPFTDRMAGKLSGGMKQKLGLCCALIHDPELLILDEPTTGIDPLSRVQFWELIESIRARSPQTTILVATSYMEEAERLDRLAVMMEGRIVRIDTPAALKAATGSETIDDAYVALMAPTAGYGRRVRLPTAPPRVSETLAVETSQLTRRFGDFTAVDGVSLAVRAGEIVGFVGPNGSGKTTTIKMLVGLLAPSAGEARMFGRPVRTHEHGHRQRLGYMAQRFSLYAELTVRRNLILHANLLGVPRQQIAARIDEFVQRFNLADVLDQRAGALPAGIRQRVALAVAVIHRPDLLILDEPTSGVDPLARDFFWELIHELSAIHGTTVLVTTHYLDEAMRCDRAILMNAGRILAYAPPHEIIEAHNAESLEQAFVACIREDQKIVETASGNKPSGNAPEATSLPAAEQADIAPVGTPEAPLPFDVRRLWAGVRLEALQLWRDQFRLFLGFLVPALLLLIFGFGLNLDIERLPYAVLDQDRTPHSRTYLQHFAASPYFTERTRARSDADVERALKSGEIRLAIKIPAGFGRALKQGRHPEIGISIDGTMPYRATTIQAYVSELHSGYLRALDQETGAGPRREAPFEIETRYWFNPNIESRYALVPGLLAMVLLFTTALITAVSIVREKELGSISNFFATPITKVEFLISKQVPFVVLGFCSFLILLALSIWAFGLTIGGSALALVTGGALFVLTGTGFGLVISCFARTQAAAVIATMILTMVPSFYYSGLMVPVSSLEGAGQVFGQIFPTSYFLNILVGVFLKDLSVSDLQQNYLSLLIFVIAFNLISVLALHKQAK